MCRQTKTHLKNEQSVGKARAPARKGWQKEKIFMEMKLHALKYSGTDTKNG